MGFQAPGAPLSEAARSCLTRARSALGEAAATTDPARRYASAHVAALWSTAALLAVRSRPSVRRSQRNAWALLAQVVPEMGEWAAFFAAGAGKRAAAEAGLRNAVSAREADDLLRDAERFLTLVEELLGVPSQQPLPGPAAKAS
ncbi:MAG: hypothetical protein GEU93_12440 [Propionibacteriales bacterium]|nr:hypothetical protein [Propionibacteriales bacterium]